MNVLDMIDLLELQGRLLVEAAAAAGTDAPVPSCPDWRVADLLRHTGEVHRWAAAVVGTAAPDDLDSLAVVGDLPADGQLTAWLAEGHQALVDTLRRAPDDLDCWHFLPATSPRAFWARRQLHETSVHRMDAELAAGRVVSPVTDQVAEDGVDELLTGFLPRASSRLRSAEPFTVLVAPEDSAARWTVAVTEQQPLTVREERPADFVLRGPVAQLYRGLWNRGPLDGDAQLVDRWRGTVNVRWS
jgi:uncharacterized protein (TIGR03083 family)